MSVDRHAFRCSGLALALLTPAFAHAAGFAVAGQGAGALGLAGSATARFELPESGFYNPAAWGLRPGFAASVGLTAVQSQVTHHAPGGVATGAGGVSVPPYLYASYGFDMPGGTLAFGITGGIPYGSAVNWGDAWEGRFEVTGIGLTAYEGAGVVSFAPSAVDGLSLAVGARYLRSTVRLSRQVDAVNTEAHVDIAGDTDGVGALAAIAYQPIPELSLGFSYRSRVRLDYAGSADFQDVPVELTVRAHDGPVRASITMPDRFAWGVGFDFGPGSASLDLEHTLWSTVQELVIDFEDEATPDVVQPRRWHDAWSVRAGYQHDDLGFEGLSLRAGLAWDQSPSPSDTLSPTSPDGDRVITSLGAAYAYAPWGLGVHVSYAHVFLLGAKATGEAFPGSYAADANLVSAGLSYQGDF